MAEHSFEALQRPTARRAEINKIGDGWGMSASRAVADDTKLHLPFDRLPPPPPPEPPPVMPTEAEHRMALADSLAAQKRADTAMAKAAEAHARALRLVEDRRQALAGYATLDEDRLAQTLDRLRDDNGGVTLPDSDDRLIRREIAAVHLADAETAEKKLAAELSLMVTAAEQATKEVNRCAVSVLSHKADAIADEHAELLRQAGRCKATLHAYDQFSANSGARMSGKVSNLLVAEGTASLARQRDTSSWRAAKVRLLADPTAEVTID